MHQDQPKKKNSLKKELKQWGFVLGLIAVLYFTGLHTEVIGGMQRVLLYTGILQPDTEITKEKTRNAYFDMPLLTLAGEKTSLFKFRGKTIFMNFWATWCPPCIAEMPNIQQLFNEVSDNDGIVFIMISLDEDPQKARDFMERKEFNMPVYFLQGRKPGIYNSTVVPTTYVISPEGEIVMEHQGMAKYNTPKFKNFLLNLSSEESLADSL